LLDSLLQENLVLYIIVGLTTFVEKWLQGQEL